MIVLMFLKTIKTIIIIVDKKTKGFVGSLFSIFHELVYGK